MPAIGNITVKKNDGTTDIVYAAMTPSSGDSTAAQYRQDAGNTAPPGHRPTLSVLTKWNGPKTARVAEINYASPYTYTDSTTGLTQSKDQVVASVRVVLPQMITQTVIDEAVSQLVNLLASTAIKDQLKAGYAAT